MNLKECQIHHQPADTADILRLEGALDSFAFPRLEAALNKLRTTGRHRIVLDCSNLTYINSAALGALIGSARRARENGGDLKLAALTPKIKGILEILGFDRILHCFPQTTDALKNFPA